MAEYSKEEIKRIEEKWRKTWVEKNVYKVSNDSPKPKYYVLDMFPYPSGAGLHVGHPLGYIASDIVARYKRLKGFNVLHPMGFDAFGLPAEQYAMKNGIHPAISTAQNIEIFKKQLANIGFCYDWSREVQTCDPKYYKWTQWIFLQIFDSWFNRKKEKAERISELIKIFEAEGNKNHPFPNSKFQIPGSNKVVFEASEWKSIDEKTKQGILMEYRLAYLAFTDVNWCEALGTVLANDEVANGVSYRGGFPVVKRQMRQWSLRITEYAERLLKGLNEIDFSDSMKDVQRNWIGKSSGARIQFEIQNSKSKIEVFTTRPDTIFGVDFMVLAPEHEFVKNITTSAQQAEIEKYLKYVESRSEVDRMAEVKRITGAFTGAYAINPLSKKEVPIWISEYVLAGYGTGAIMGVPSGDERDHKFAKHFNLPITNIIGSFYDGKEANPTYDATLENSGFLNGMKMKDAQEVVIKKVEELGIGKRQINYKMRDAGWSRQRYWGEPFPVIYKDYEKDLMPYAIDESTLPLQLPPSNNFQPYGNGEGPLAHLKDWIHPEYGLTRDSNTMPTHAGAAWYFLRYMDPHNENAFADKKALDYWGQVDVYIGGSEHAVAHLLYSRLWVKILHDLGYLNFDEPFKKLINQGKITGVSQYLKEVLPSSKWKENHKYPMELILNVFKNNIKIMELMVKVNTPGHHRYVTQESDLTFKYEDELTRELIDAQIIEDYANVEYAFEEGGKYFLDVKSWLKDEPVYTPSYLFNNYGYWHNGTWNTFKGSETNKDHIEMRPAIEKMSKSYLNVINPDKVVENYGADTLRMYEMFLGPLEQSKPWNTNGIDGVFKFLRRFWNLFHDSAGNFKLSDAEPTRDELKVFHKTIKKIAHDIDNYSFNTSVSEFMICANELSSMKCNKRSILEPLVVALAPFAPHIAEELWEKLGHKDTIFNASFPPHDEQYLTESSFNYPISINGKVRAQMNFALDMPKEDIEKVVLASEIVLKWTEGKPPKKVIVVPGKIVNVVL